MTRCPVARWSWFAGVVLATCGLGCWQSPEVGPLIEGSSSSIEVDAPFSAIQTKIWNPHCATSLCHVGNPSPHTPVSLEANQAYSNMVNRPASQAPSILLVNPGHPEQSYLMLKLLGTVGTSGAVSTRMPITYSLSSDQIEAVRAWILRGAPND